MANRGKWRDNLTTTKKTKNNNKNKKGKKKTTAPKNKHRASETTRTQTQKSVSSASKIIKSSVSSASKIIKSNVVASKPENKGFKTRSGAISAPKSAFNPSVKEKPNQISSFNKSNIKSNIDKRNTEKQKNDKAKADNRPEENKQLISNLNHSRVGVHSKDGKKGKAEKFVEGAMAYTVEDHAQRVATLPSKVVAGTLKNSQDRAGHGNKGKDGSIKLVGNERSGHGTNAPIVAEQRRKIREEYERNKKAHEKSGYDYGNTIIKTADKTTNKLNKAFNEIKGKDMEHAVEDLDNEKLYSIPYITNKGKKQAVEQVTAQAKPEINKSYKDAVSKQISDYETEVRNKYGITLTDDFEFEDGSTWADVKNSMYAEGKTLAKQSLNDYVKEQTKDAGKMTSQDIGRLGVQMINEGVDYLIPYGLTTGKALVTADKMLAKLASAGSKAGKLGGKAGKTIDKAIKAGKFDAKTAEILSKNLKNKARLKNLGRELTANALQDATIGTTLDLYTGMRDGYKGEDLVNYMKENAVANLVLGAPITAIAGRSGAKEIKKAMVGESVDALNKGLKMSDAEWRELIALNTKANSKAEMTEAEIARRAELQSKSTYLGGAEINSKGNISARNENDITDIMSQAEVKDYINLKAKGTMGARLKPEERGRLNALETKVENAYKVTETKALNSLRGNVTSKSVETLKNSIKFFERTGDNANLNKAQKRLDKALMLNADKTESIAETARVLSDNTNVKYEVVSPEEMARAITENGTKVSADDVIKGVYLEQKDGTVKVLLNNESPQAHQVVAGHESGHIIKTASSEDFDALGVMLSKYAKERGEYEDLVAEMSRSYVGESDEAFQEEVICEMIGRYIFGEDDTFIKQLAGEKPSVLQQIADYIKGLLGKTTNKELREEYTRILNSMPEKFRHSDVDASPVLEYTQKTEGANYGRYGSEKNGRTTVRDGSEQGHVLERDTANTVGGNGEGYDRMAMSKSEGTSKANDTTRIETEQTVVKSVVDDKGEVTKEANDAYMKAVENGDMETAQKYIDKLAEARFKDTVVKFKNGKLKRQFHGTTSGGFRVFMGKSEMGHHFGTKATAKNRIYGERNQRIIEAYLDIKNPIVFDKDLGSWDADHRLIDELFYKKVLSVDEYNHFLKNPSERTNANIIKLLQGKGYDGIQYPNWFESSSGSTSYIVFDSKQIKSSDPVTHDSEGLVIPLKNRFTQKNPDIYFSKEKKPTEDVGSFNESKTDMRFSKVGKNSEALTDKQRADADVATTLRKSGMSNDEIKKLTGGWYVGQDGKPRLEISDKDATINADLVRKFDKNSSKYSTIFLDEVLQHDEIFRHYPEARSILVVGVDNAGFKGSMSGKVMEIDKTLGEAEMRRTVLHELQHYIQDNEGFAKGSSPEFYKAVQDDIDKYLDKIFDDLDERGLSPSVEEMKLAENSGENGVKELLKSRVKQTPNDIKEFEGIYDLSRKLGYAFDDGEFTFTGNTPETNYYFTIGEEEARNTAMHSGLSQEEIDNAPAPQYSENNVLRNADDIGSAHNSAFKSHLSSESKSEYNDIRGANNEEEFNGRTAKNVQQTSGAVQGQSKNSSGNQGFNGTEEKSYGVSKYARNVLTDKQASEFDAVGIKHDNVKDITEDPDNFILNLKHNADSQRRGVCVDTDYKSQDLHNAKLYYILDGEATIGVRPDGDIFGVAKLSGSSASIEEGLYVAIANGGKKMDAYGSHLVNLYAQYGFEPVARVKYSEDVIRQFNSPEEAERKIAVFNEMRDNGIEPDVYVFMHNGDDIKTIKNSEYAVWDDEALAKLKTFEPNEYEDALNYRDKLLSDKETRNNASKYEAEIADLKEQRTKLVAERDAISPKTKVERDINKRKRLTQDIRNIDRKIRRRQNSIATDVREKAGVSSEDVTNMTSEALNKEAKYLGGRLKNGKTPEHQQARTARLKEVNDELKKRGDYQPSKQEQVDQLIKEKGYGWEKAKEYNDEIAKLRKKEATLKEKIKAVGEAKDVKKLSKQLDEVQKDIKSNTKKLYDTVDQSKSTFDEGKDILEQAKERGGGNTVKVNKATWKDLVKEEDTTRPRDFGTTIRRLFETSLIDFETTAKKLMKSTNAEDRALGKRLLDQTNSVYTARNRSAYMVEGKNGLNDAFKVEYNGKTVDLLTNDAMRKDFSDYLFYKHAIGNRHELNKDVFGDMYTQRDLTDLMGALEKKYGKDTLETFEKNVRGYIDKLNQYRLDAGLLKNTKFEDPVTGKVFKNEYEFLKDRYPYYVPTNRVGLEKVSNYEMPTGSASIDSGIKTATGSDKPLEELYLQLVKMTDRTVKSSEQNRMMNLYAKAKGFDVEALKKAKPEDIETTSIGAQEVTKGKWRVAFMQDGEKVTIPVNRHCAKGLREWNGQDFATLLNVCGKFSGVARPYKGLITDWNLIFGARNGMRDQQQAIVNSVDSYWYGKSIPRTLASLDPTLTGKECPFRELYEANGGKWSSIAQYNSLEDLTSLNKNGLKKANEKTIGKVLDHIENINGAIELVPRLSEFIGTLQKEADGILKKEGSSVSKLFDEIKKSVERDGLSGTKLTQEVEARYANAIIDKLKSAGNFDDIVRSAMRNSADITLNFSRSGVITKALNSGLFPYLNPSVQGLSKTMRLFTEGYNNGTLVNFLMKLGVCTVAPSVVNELLLAGNDEYQSLNTRDKDMNFFIPCGDGQFIKIPKPRENAVLSEPFVYATRWLLDSAQYGTMSEMKQMFVSAKDNIGVIDAGDFIFAPLVKNFVQNQNWYGGKILNNQELRNEENGEAYKNYDESTSWVAKKLGGLINMSPKRIDNIMDSYMGVAYDFGISQFSEKAKNDLSWKYNPVTVQFMKDSVFSNKYTTQFWDKADKLNNGAKGGNDTREYTEFMAKYGNDTFTYDQAISDIDTDKSIPKGVKSDMKRELRKYKNSLVRRGLEGKDVVYDPMQRIINTYEKYGVKNSVDKALSTFAYGDHKDAYEYMKSTKEYRDATPKEKKELQQKFLNTYKGIKRIARNTGDQDSFINYSTVAYVCAKNGYTKGYIANCYCVKSKEYSVDKMIKRSQKYIDAGYTTKNFETTMRTLNRGCDKLGDDDKRYASQLDDYDKAMILAENGYRDGAYYIASPYLDSRMNAGRCLTDGHSNGKFKWTDKRINNFCNEYNIVHDKNYEWDTDYIVDCINKKYGNKSMEEKASVYQVITGDTKNFPFGDIGDYSHKNDTGIEDGKKTGGRRGGRRGRRGRRGGSGGSGTMPTTKSGAIKGKVTDPFKHTSNTSSASNLNDAYRKKVKKLREKTYS